MPSKIWKRRLVRRMMVEEGRRIDGRRFDEIRPISVETGILPRTHGSAIFSRGETQAMAIVTLGSSSDEQRIDSLGGETFKSFMLHYNFPPYSVGEVKPLRGPGRREIGHGALAERLGEGRPAQRRGIPLHHSHRLGSPVIQRFQFHGHRLRRHPGPHGRRRAPDRCRGG